MTELSRVVFVDDDSSLLSGLRRMLRCRRHEWSMSFVGTGEEALRMCETESVDVVVSDIRMPGMNGIELFTALKERRPDVVRIALSGDASAESELDCARICHQFVAKPTDAATLSTVVSRTLALRERLANPALRAMLGSNLTLPSLPAVYQEVLDEAADPEGSIYRIGELAGSDLAMAAKLLALVNSAYFRLPRRVESVGEAAALLGVQTIKALLLSNEIFRSYQGEALGGLNIELLAARGFRVAQRAQALAIALGLPKGMSGEAFMAGMLHEFGKLVLALCDPERYRAVLTRVENGEDSTAAEVACFGVEHHTAGSYLLGIWGLPDTIIEAVMYQAKPEDAFSTSVSVLTVLYLARSFGECGNSPEARPEGYLSDVLDDAQWRSCREAILELAEDQAA